MDQVFLFHLDVLRIRVYQGVQEGLQDQGDLRDRRDRQDLQDLQGRHIQEGLDIQGDLQDQEDQVEHK